MSASLAVCSWSLRPESPRDLVDKVRASGVSAVQLALGPIRRGEWDETETVSLLKDAGIEIVSGMMETAGEDYSTLETIRETGGVRPDATWQENLAGAQLDAELAARIGIRLVTFHAGFIPHDRADPEWSKLIGRLRDIVDVYHDHGVRLGLETGQETADTLIEALDALDRPSAGVNFDPANMILYAMGDPNASIATLAPRVVQIHIKDANRAATPGTWGAEVPVGTGEVDWAGFFAIVGERLRTCDLVIEREAGDDRVNDVIKAASVVREMAGWIERDAPG